LSNFTPLISILVPVYNKANYIKESINSLLEQSYPNVEILIYDDFSTDESLSIIKDIDDKRIFIHTGTENKGVRYGRDYLLNKANGDFISFFDADDLCHKNKYIKIFKYFNNNPGIDIIGSRVNYINDKGIKLYKPFTFESYSVEDIKANLFFCNTISTSTVVFKKKVAENIKFLDFKYIIGEDYFEWIKLTETYNFINLPEKLVTYRVTDHGMMGNTKSSYAEAINFIHSYQFKNLNIKPYKSILDIHNRFMFEKFISKIYLLKSIIFYDYLLLHSNKKYHLESFLNQIRVNWLRKCIVFSKTNPISSIYIYLFYFKKHDFKSIINTYILIIFSIKFSINYFINDEE
jgi:glycosyltransferase involved in cell wall biosynthesis